MKRNITLSLDGELLRKARVVAARRHTSISRMLGQELKRMVEEIEGYDSAKRRALGKLKAGFHLGGTKPAPREELHERRDLS